MESGSFAPAGSLGEGREEHDATLLPDWRVLVMGGRTADNEIRATAEVWDPMSSSFTPAGSLPEGRYGHTVTLMPDGRFLVVSGQVVDEDPSQG